MVMHVGNDFQGLRQAAVQQGFEQIINLRAVRKAQHVAHLICGDHAIGHRHGLIQD